MKVSEANKHLNFMTNLIMEQRRVLEVSIDRKIRIEREKKFNAIKEDYYRRNPEALRYVPAIALREGEIE